MKKYQVNFYLDDTLVASGDIEAKNKDYAIMNAELIMNVKCNHINYNKVEAEEVYEGLGEFGEDEGW